MIKKILVVIPFIIFSSYNAWRYYNGSFNGVMAIDLLLNMLPLYLFVFFSVYKTKKMNFLDIIIQALFYVYLFYTWFFTISYIPYFHFITLDILPSALQTLPRYNLFPFETIRGSITPLNIYGNILLLLPFGLFVPLMYKRFLKLSSFMLLIFLVILGIENTQLVVAFIDGMFYEYPYDRSWDIDDLILNFIGATIGFFISKYICLPIYYKVLQWTGVSKVKY